MSSFRQQLALPPARRSRARPSKPSDPAPAVPASAPSPAPKPQQRDTSAVGPSTRREKRKWPTEFVLESPDVVNPESLTAGSRGTAREAQAGYMQLERLTEIAATQPSVEERYTPNTEIVEVVKRLPEYLQPVVTLMATMVPHLKRAIERKWVGKHWPRL